MQKTVGESLYGSHPRSLLNLILTIVIWVFVVLLSAELLFNAFYISIYVDGTSMLPTLNGATNEYTAGGDYVYVNMATDPDYGDIVVLEKHEFGHASFNIIKRAIAFEGDAVMMDHGQLYLKKAGEDKFTPVDESYIDPDRCNPEKSVNSFEEHVVGKGGIFLMGDNRNDSHDSRMDGDYPIADLVGVVPGWAMAMKGQITGFYTFFKFTLPESLGIL